jgi:hypothetical protein
MCAVYILLGQTLSNQALAFHQGCSVSSAHVQAVPFMPHGCAFVFVRWQRTTYAPAHTTSTVRLPLQRCWPPVPPIHSHVTHSCLLIINYVVRCRFSQARTLLPSALTVVFYRLVDVGRLLGSCWKTGLMKTRSPTHARQTPAAGKQAVKRTAKTPRTASRTCNTPSLVTQRSDLLTCKLAAKTGLIPLLTLKLAAKQGLIPKAPPPFALFLKTCFVANPIGKGDYTAEMKKLAQEWKNLPATEKVLISKDSGLGNQKQICM